MGPLSLYLRVPFAAVGVAFGDGALASTGGAALPCLIVLGLVAVWLARFAGRRGAGRPAQILIVGVVLLDPLVDSALYWGHPEEILTAALGTGAIIAALEQRSLAAGALVGLAIASKQWALVLLIPVVLILVRDRRRTAVIAIGLAALSSVPMIIGNFASFRHVFRYISSPQPIVTAFTWLFPFSPIRPGQDQRHQRGPGAVHRPPDPAARDDALAPADCDHRSGTAAARVVARGGRCDPA